MSPHDLHEIGDLDHIGVFKVDPDDSDLSEAETLLNRTGKTTPQKPTGNRKKASGSLLQSIKEGNRNNELTRFAGVLRHLGLNESELLPCLQVLNSSRCDPPCEESELQSIARSISTYSAGESKTDTASDSQADRLVELAHETGIELFRSPDGDTFGKVQVREVCDVRRVADLGSWLRRVFYEREKKSPTRESIIRAIDHLQSEAEFCGDVRRVHVRIAKVSDAVYLDLADEQRRVVRISRVGWELDLSCPVMFIRPRGMLPLPEPKHGGSINQLRPLFEPIEDDSWKLITSWLLGAVHPTGPYPILMIGGSQGSAKSTRTKLLRNLIDPNVCPIRSVPKEEQELSISAKLSHVQAFDNVSRINEDKSNMLCRLATGGGLSVRTLYTTDGETLFSACRPMILNGITDFVTMPDLLDRTIVTTMKEIDGYKEESEIFAQFEAVRPQVLGALLDAVSSAMANVDTITGRTWPRMADFAKFVTAAESALEWPEGEFARVYSRARREAVALGLEADVVGIAIHSFMEELPEWKGTATALLTQLKDHIPEDLSRNLSWPRTPHAFSSRLRRLTPGLRAEGIAVEFQPRKSGLRPLRLYRILSVTGVTSVTNLVKSAPGVHPADDSNLEVLTPRSASSVTADANNDAYDGLVEIFRSRRLRGKPRQ